MKNTKSLRLNYQFKHLYDRGIQSRANSIVIYYLKNNKNINNLGITVSSKLGKAVTRNRIKRRIKEAYRLNEDNLKIGYNLVIVARQMAVTSDYYKIKKDLIYLLKKNGIWNL